jgi:cell wall-associated NlpC family hydrolase
MVFKISGHTLPWDLNQQGSCGKKVNDTSCTVPGDLAFFKDKSGKIIHAGIVLEENKIIHAFGQVRIDLLNDEGILNADTKVYTHTLAQIKRILA